MGKGDKKTKRGKIILGSHGVTRPRKSSSSHAKPTVVDEVQDSPKSKPKAKPAKKAKEE
jgi:30S ribosomal protein S31